VSGRIGPVRARIARLIARPGFEHAVLALILVNAVTVGLETSSAVVARFGGPLDAVNGALLLLFTAEIVLRIIARRGAFFRDPWGLFDLVVVGVTWLPVDGDLSVLRSIRVLRLLSIMPSLRGVVGAMLGALPGMSSILLLMGIMFYVFGVLATRLYGDVMPEKFGTLGASIFTLFQLMTLEAWVEDIVGPASEGRPLALLFFIPFIVLSTFVVLNLFLGVIVESIQTLREERESADARAAEEAARAAAARNHAENQVLLAEVRALRAEIATLHAPRAAPPNGAAATGRA